MIKILNSSNETLAILQNVTNAILSEDINREKTFDFTTIIDNDKSDYVNYQNKIEIESDYFNIIYTEEERTQESLTINAQCEHVSYDLIDIVLTAGFTATGVFSAVTTTLLSGTSFTVGASEITASQTISVNESTNKRQVLVQLASLYGGELKFSKYEISLLTQRGSDSGVQFRYRKNLAGVKRTVDNRKKVGGLPTISYQVSVAELEFEQSYIDKGINDLERYGLGDTVRVIDENLNIDTKIRIVKVSYDPLQRMQGTVEISNLTEDITDTITNIQTTSVAKNSIYNGVSIGPDDGFVATRSDDLVETTMNATEGISIDLRPTTTASYTSVFYVQVDTATGTAKLYLAGNAVFTGEVVGGSILIGSGSNTFNANGTDGIWLGSTAFATAPFNVSLSGALTATSADIIGSITGSTITGSAISGGTINVDTDIHVGNDIYVGDNDAVNKDMRMRTTGDADCVMRAWTVDGPTLTFGYLLATQSSGSTLSALDLLYVIAQDTWLTGGLRIDGNIGFFGHSTALKDSVSDLAGFTNVATGSDTIDLSDLNTKLSSVHNKVNELLNSLQSYGLV